MLEVNPRASRTVPFVSKAVGRPLAKIAARVMVGESLEDLGFTEEPQAAHVSVKEAVLPFAKFVGADPFLGPEMKSTGEVMGIAQTFGEAFAKSQMAAGDEIPMAGRAFISVNDPDHAGVVPEALVALRRSGESWTRLAERYGVGAPELHLPVPDEAETGPLSSVYQSFRGLPPSRWREIRLAPEDIVALVNVGLLAQTLGVSPAEVLARAGSTDSYVRLYGELIR